MESLSFQTIHLWRDYSTGPFQSHVFTLTADDGRLLLAALSVFVTLVGGSTWTLASFVLHQLKTDHKASQDGLYFQIQVLLRNPVSPGAAIKEALFVWWAWRPRKSEKRVHHLKRRLSLVYGPALLTFLGFSAAGVFVSKVARPVNESSDVLLKDIRCGAWGFDLSSQSGIAAAQDKNANDTRNARAYAQNCYEQRSQTGICSLYPTAYIDFSQSDVPCPFDPDPAAGNACLYGQNQAMQLDTGLLNSNHIFGVNTGPQDQIFVRKVVTCSPFHASYYVNQSLSSGGGYTIWNFDLGSLNGSTSNYTYSYNTYGRQARIGFSLYSVSTVDDTWRPVQALKNPDAEVSAHFLSQNSVIYNEKVEDIWFSATDTESQAEGYYGPSEYTNVLTCTEQYQLVNPVSGSQSSLSTVEDLRHQYLDLGFNAYQEAIATRLMLSFSLSSMFNTISNLGASSLLASDHILELVGTTLPADQWQREVRSWFETSLARIQWFIIEYNANTVDLGDQGFISSPSEASQDPVDKAQVRLCSLQRVRNTGDCQTFSFWGIIITVSVGVVLIILSLCLEFCVKSCRRKYTNKHPHREIARVADNKFQLVRKNLRSTGQTSERVDEENAWDDVMDEVPVAKPNVQFWTPQGKGSDYRYDRTSEPDSGRSSEQQAESHEMSLLQNPAVNR